MKTNGPFIASFDELAANARGKPQPQKHITEKNSFGLITKSDERFLKERPEMLWHQNEMNQSLKQLYDAMGDVKKEKNNTKSVLLS